MEAQAAELAESVSAREQREEELSRRALQLEERAQEADERLTLARKDLLLLSDIGLASGDLTAFAARVSAAAQRHGIGPEQLRDRLLRELEHLDAGASLQGAVEARRRELEREEKAIEEAGRRRAALESGITELRKQQAALEAATRAKAKHLTEHADAIAGALKQDGVKLRQALSGAIGESLAEVRTLRDEALALGKEIGRLDETIEANRWLQGLISLVSGGPEVRGEEVRVTGLAVLRGLSAWLQRSGAASPPSLLRHVKTFVEELEQWRP